MRLRLLWRGIKRLDKRRRGPWQKMAAATALLLEAAINGGLDFTKWEGRARAAALIFGFKTLRRSGEFLRKEEHPDPDKSARAGDITLAEDGTSVACAPKACGGAKEAVAVQRMSRADQEGRGAATSTFKVSDERL